MTLTGKWEEDDFKMWSINMWPWTTKPVLSVNSSIFDIHTASESRISELYIDVWFVMIGIWSRYNIWKWNLRVQRNHNIEKIAFKVVQIKFLTMHITKQKLRFYLFTVRNLQNVFMEHVLYLIS